MHIPSIALLLPFSNESTGPTSFLFFSFCTHKYRVFFFCSLFAVYVYKRITRTCLELSSALRGGKREEKWLEALSPGLAQHTKNGRGVELTDWAPPHRKTAANVTWERRRDPIGCLLSAGQSQELK